MWACWVLCVIPDSEPFSDFEPSAVKHLIVTRSIKPAMISPLWQELKERPLIKWPPVGLICVIYRQAFWISPAISHVVVDSVMIQ